MAASPADTPLKRYRRALAQVRAERGERCECCGVPARAAHHVNAVGTTGIASALVSEPSNLLVICDDCHALFHPGRRVYPWLTVGKRRTTALRRSR